MPPCAPPSFSQISEAVRFPKGVEIAVAVQVCQRHNSGVRVAQGLAAVGKIAGRATLHVTII